MPPSSSTFRRGGPRGVSAVTPASNAPLPPTLTYYNFSLALVEVLFSLMEFLFALVVIKECLTSLYTALHSDSPTPPPYNAFLLHLLTNVLTLNIVTFRLAQRLRVPWLSLPDRLGLTQPRLSSTTAAVVALHTVGFVGMLVSQWYFGERLFSLRNYYAKGGDELEPAMISDMLLLAPLREELVFRAALFCVFYMRLGDDTAVSKLLCCGLSGVVFGLVHLMNLLGTRYSPLYIALQVGLGVLLGNFYALRFVLDESLLQSVIMHAINNLYSRSAADRRRRADASEASVLESGALTSASPVRRCVGQLRAAGCGARPHQPAHRRATSAADTHSPRTHRSLRLLGLSYRLTLLCCSSGDGSCASAADAHRVQRAHRDERSAAARLGRQAVRSADTHPGRRADGSGGAEPGSHERAGGEAERWQQSDWRGEQRGCSQQARAQKEAVTRCAVLGSHTNRHVQPSTRNLHEVKSRFCTYRDTAAGG